MNRFALRLMAPFALLTLAAFALAACGDDDGGSSGEPASPPPGVPAGAPFIDQQDLSFKPDKLTAKASDKVYFANTETALHTVTIEGKNESGTMKKGDLFTWTPPAPGTYKISCDFHPQMHATVTVQ